MATAYRNLVNHLELAIRGQLELLNKNVAAEREDKLLELVDTINGLVLSFMDSGSQLLWRD